jgi:hypothetical protein
LHIKRSISFKLAREKLGEWAQMFVVHCSNLEF